MKRGRDSPTESKSSKFTKNPNNERIERRCTFQIDEPIYKNSEISSTAEFKIKSHQSTPYPKQKIKQLKEEEDNDLMMIKNQSTTNQLSKKSEIICEKRNPEFLKKLGCLNRSFIRWIDIYFHKGYDEGSNYDFTPVCNDYIKFINNLKEKYPIENNPASSKDNSSLSNNVNEKSNFLNESSTNSPNKFKLSMFSNALYTNTPPPNPGDKDYKSTPFPKHLLHKNQQQQQNNESNKLKAISDNKLVSNTNTQLNSELLFTQQPQQQINKTTEEDGKIKEIKFPTFNLSPTKTATSTITTNESAQFNNNQFTASNTINKNLFDIIPKSTTSVSTPDKIGLETKTSDNFFSTENIFKSQFDQSSKLNDQSIFNQSSFNMTSNSTTNISSAQANDDENYVPPKPEVCQVNEDAVHSVKCKLFFKKSTSYVEKGIGTLYIKETNEEAGNQLLIRADNSLGTILLNIRLKSGLPISTTKTGLLLTCIPNPPLDDKKTETETETASFYIKVKTNEIRDELMKFIKQYSI